MACRVDQPPRRPSTKGERRRRMWPWWERGKEGVETRINVRSLILWGFVCLI